MGAKRLMWWNFEVIKKNWIYLIVIFLLAFFLRVIAIDKIPPGFTWDEAALGYNAYSILQTGKDEWGESFPIIFKSFGDYKPGLYVYLTLPFIAIFGLNELSTRLPSIILGSLIPLVGYLILARVLPLQKYVGIIFALLLAISPWAIQFSRGAWETNVALFLFLLGLFFLIRFIQGKKWSLFLFIMFFSLSIYTYQGAKLFATLFILITVFLYREFFLSKKKVIFTILGLILFLLFLLGSIANPDVKDRLEVLNQYKYKRTPQEISAIKKEEENTSLLEFNIFHSHNLEYLRTITGRYLNYYSPKFLFIDGGPDGRQGVYSYGMMHQLEIPFLILGIVFFLRSKVIKEKKLFLLWLLIAPLGATLSIDVVNTVRTLPLVFSLELFTALGIYYFFLLLKKHRLLIGILLFFLFFANFLFYLDRYFVHSPTYFAQFWLYGHRDVIDYVRKNQGKYNKVIFTTFYNEPYIFYLFYSKYDPAKFQKQAVLEKRGKYVGDVGEVPKIDNIEFRPIYWPNDRFIKNRLYVGSWLELPDKDIDPKEAKLLKVIYFLNRDKNLENSSFRIVETKP